MGKPIPAPSKGQEKRRSQPNRPRKGARADVAFIPPIRRGQLQELHEALDRALPCPMSEVTTEIMRDLDSAVWEPGLTTQEFRERYLNACVLKRWQGGSKEDAESRRETAYQKLRDSEIRCANTNQIFTGPEALDWSNARIPLHLQKVYKRARCIIGRVLGQFDLDEFPLHVDFTPGATTEFPRRSSKVSNKWQNGSHITPKAMPYGVAFRQWCQAPSGDVDSSHRKVRDTWPEFRAWESNTVFTVPKRFDTDRTAAKGATWNNALQKALGSMVRSRCQRNSEPLLRPDAQMFHGLMAKLGSRTGWLVTADLVGASDCVTVGHVLTFFPDTWARPMLDLREEYGTFPDGTTVRWEKIGSMGNGFTFEVETLLFYGIVKACCDRKSLVSVYGDDLIYPEKHHELVVEALAFAGFEINREKTFSGNHPFRESCGAYYHCGVDVKPFYIENPPTSMGAVIRLHNDVVRWHRNPHPDGPWGEVIQQCRAIVPKRYWGPLGVAGCLWAEWDECAPRYKPSCQSWQVLGVLPEVDTAEDENFLGRYLAYLWKGYTTSTKRRLTPWEIRTRGTLTGYSGDDLLGNGSEPGYHSKVTEREKCKRVYVDRVQWNQMTAHNIELESRAYFTRV